MVKACSGTIDLLVLTRLVTLLRVQDFSFLFSGDQLY
jgi:hypothetical protein